MANTAFKLICGTLLAIGLPCTAMAQDAAETAAILAGTGQGTGNAARSLGDAVAQGINAAMEQLASAMGAGPTPGPAPSPAAATDGGSDRQVGVGYSVPAIGDVLLGTSASTNRLGGGSVIRVSGRLVPGPQTTCTSNCLDDLAGSSSLP